MTTAEKALLASSPGITLLVAGLVWFVLDPKGDARQHCIDRGHPVPRPSARSRAVLTNGEPP